MADETGQWRPARHGDRWVSTLMIVAVRGQSTNLANWHIRAQARARTEDPEPTFEWSVADGTILVGSAELRVKTGALVQAGTIQLLIRPADWAGKPRKWRGVADVEISSDSTDAPEDRITIVADRPFVVTPDVAR